jgi:hypothetical protein
MDAVALQGEDWLALGTESSSAELELPTMFDHPLASPASELECHRNARGAGGTVPLDNLAITAPTTSRCDKPVSSLSLPVEEEGRLGQLETRLVSPTRSSSRLVNLSRNGPRATAVVPQCNRTQARVFPCL